MRRSRFICWSAASEGIARQRVQQSMPPRWRQKSAHGVLKIGATRAADNGATMAEREAIFG
jgi:hypothetical protein